MAKYARRRDLVENSLAFKMFGKRLCDFDYSQLKEYNRISKQKSRQKDEIKQKEKTYHCEYFKKRGVLNDAK